MKYNKWFQTEENDSDKVFDMVTELKNKIPYMVDMDEENAWQCIIELAYINHSAYKVRKGYWDLYPDEELTDEDKALNGFVYNAKDELLKYAIEAFVKRGWNISTNEDKTTVLFREPSTQVRQITFHTYKGDELFDDITDNTGTFDGVTQAHHYIDDSSYINALKN